MSAPIVKLSFGGDLRRVRLEGPASSSFAALLNVIHTTFPSAALALGGRPPLVQYEDDESEVITIASDGELQEALRVCKDLARPSLRLTITVPTTEGVVRGVKEEAEEESVKRARVADVVPEAPAAAVSAPPLPSLPSPPPVAPAAPARQGVPVEKLVALVALLRGAYGAGGDVSTLISSVMSVMGSPAVASLLSSVLPLLPNIPAVLEVVSTSPALAELLALPAIAPYAASVGITIDECVLPSAPSSSPSSPPPFPSLFGALLSQFAGLDLSGFVAEVNGEAVYSSSSSDEDSDDGAGPSAPAPTSSDAKAARRAEKKARKAERKARKAERKAEKAARKAASASAAASGFPGVSVSHPGDLPVHHRVSCDGCGMGPIIGSRWQCTVCPPSFDLCGVCYGDGSRHPHPCALIQVPVDYFAPQEAPAAPAVTPDGLPIHSGITCDGCNVSPITGPRFKCCVCPDYDLCGACESGDVHTVHPLLKIREPNQAPAKMITVLKEGQLPAQAVHATVDHCPPWRRGGGHQHPFAQMFRGGRGGGWGGCGWGGRGRKHDRSWSWGRGSSPAEGPAGTPGNGNAGEESAEVQAAIAESLRTESVTTVVAPPSKPEEASAPPKQAVTMSFVRPEPEEFSARFVTHVTLTDASPITPGSTVVKTWRMKNEGNAPWPLGCRLVHVGAETLGCPPDGVPVPPVSPGQSFDVSVPLVAPDLPGRHVGYFRLVTGEGVRFGHRIWADLFVENTNVPAVLRTLASPVIPAPAPAPLPAVPTAPPAVVSPAPPALPAVPPTHGKWHAQLMSLADMGFTDVDAAVAALESTQGNLARAIELLVSSA